MRDKPVLGQGPPKGSCGPGADHSGGGLWESPVAGRAAATQPQCEWGYMIQRPGQLGLLYTKESTKFISNPKLGVLSDA